MHEISICKRIYDEALEAGAKSSITLKVGDLAHCSAEEIEDTMHDIAPGFEIKTIKEKAMTHCPKCSTLAKPNILEKGHGYAIYECQKCQNKKDLKILAGGSIKITEVE